MALRLDKIFFLLSLCLASIGFSQTEGPKPPKVPNYKDSTFQSFSKMRFKIAQAQINALKNGGALLVRLKTNANTISRLKSSGNNDLAIQLQLETDVGNKIIMASYLKEFTFCPVYFFYSHRSDSVKQKKLSGILLDTLLEENPNIICNSSFYLIAEESQVYNSSLGLVPESDAPLAIEKGTASRDDVPIVIKNRFFIQLHKPFPYFQIRRSFKEPIIPVRNGFGLDLNALQYQIKKITKNSQRSKQLIGIELCVRAINEKFEKYYLKHKGYLLPTELSQYIY